MVEWVHDRLFFSNILNGSTKEEIMKLFRIIGEVMDVHMARNKWQEFLFHHIQWG